MKIKAVKKKLPIKTVRLDNYRDLKIHLIRNNLSIAQLAEEFDTTRMVMWRILKGERPNSALCEPVFKRIGVDLESYREALPAKRVYTTS